MKACTIKQSAISIRPGVYNEKELARLCDELKKSRDEVFIEFVADKSEDCNIAIEDCAHVARRLKTCSAVKGVAIPSLLLAKDGSGALEEGSYTETFMERLHEKHPQYIFCASSFELGKSGVDESEAKGVFELY